MNIRLRFVCVCVLILSHTFAFAQNDGGNAISFVDPSSSAFFKEYVEKNQLSAPTRGVPVLILSRRGANDCDIVLTMFSLLSQVDDNPPTNYGYVENRLVLIYDETEHLLKKPKAWLINLKKVLQRDLCDNTQLVTH
ncbi:hypothetical protein GCM10027341_43170 [Spirosoma knui]